MDTAADEDLLELIAGDNAEGIDLGVIKDQLEGEEEDSDALTDEEVLALVEYEINQAEYSADNSNNASDDRDKALQYYLGTARGDELEGRSTVISMDVADVVEWILPQAVRAFTMNSELVQFDPVSEEDEKQAKMESMYVHHVFKKQDSHYEFLYGFIKDALLAKNGISKTWWADVSKRRTETYEQLTDEEFASLLEGDDNSEVKPIEHTEYQQEFPTQMVAPELLQQAQQQQQRIMQQIQQAEQQLQQAMEQGAPVEQLEQMASQVQMMMQQAEQVMQQIMPPEKSPITLHDLKLRRTNTRGCVQIKCIDPDRFLISRDADSLTIGNARFSAHWEPLMASDLIAEGVDPDVVDGLPDYSSEGTAAFRQGEEAWNDAMDPSTRQIRVYECYIMCDRDGDGIAELLKVRCAGPDSFSLIDIEEVDDNPFASITPFILTHNFHGLSIYDKIKQVQDQKTTLWRQILDNLYLQNNRRTIVVDGQVNLDDLLTSRPGGIVRAATTDSVQPFPIDPIGQDGYTMLEYLDKVRTERTGTSPEGTSQAFPVGADTAHGLERLMTMKEELVGLIIRTFAETGLKRIALQVRELLIKHQNKAEMVKMTGNWVRVDPQSWSDRHNTTVGVILGVGDKIRRQASAEQVLQKQVQIIENGGMNRLTTEGRIYNALSEFVRYGELGETDDFFLDPSSDEAKELIKQAEAEPDEPGDLEKAALVTAKGEMEVADMKRDTAFQLEQSKARTAALSEQSKIHITQMKGEIEMLKGQINDQKAANANSLELTKLYEELTYKYDALEAEYNIDIPGKGTE